MKYWCADVEFSPIVIEDIEAETREEAKEKLLEILKDYVRQIQWCYRFREDNIHIKPYLTDTRRYGEVEIIRY